MVQQIQLKQKRQQNLKVQASQRELVINNQAQKLQLITQFIPVVAIIQLIIVI